MNKRDYESIGYLLSESESFQEFRETRQRQVDEFNNDIKQTSQLLAEHVFGFTTGDLIEDRHGIKYIAGRLVYGWHNFAQVDGFKLKKDGKPSKVSCYVGANDSVKKVEL